MHHPVFWSSHHKNWAQCFLMYIDNVYRPNRRCMHNFSMIWACECGKKDLVLALPNQHLHIDDGTQMIPISMCLVLIWQCKDQKTGWCTKAHANYFANGNNSKHLTFSIIKYLQIQYVAQEKEWKWLPMTFKVMGEWYWSIKTGKRVEAHQEGFKINEGKVGIRWRMCGFGDKPWHTQLLSYFWL